MYWVLSGIQITFPPENEFFLKMHTDGTVDVLLHSWSKALLEVNNPLCKKFTEFKGTY